MGSSSGTALLRQVRTRCCEVKRKDDVVFPFEIDANSDVPLWIQLRQRLIYLINSGYFEPGDQLPTVRGLASEISINYNTVNKAYLSLVSDGYLESTRGRGVFVRDMDAGADEEFAHELDGILNDCVSACRCLGMSLDDIGTAMSSKIIKLKREERAKMLKEECREGKPSGSANEPSQGGRIVDVGSEITRRVSGTGA